MNYFSKKNLSYKKEGLIVKRDAKTGKVSVSVKLLDREKKLVIFSQNMKKKVMNAQWLQ